MPRRRASSQRGIIVLLVTILLVIYGVFSSLTGSGVTINIGATPTSSSNIPSTLPAGTNTSGTSWWQVYFTDPLTIKDPRHMAGSIEQHLIDHINAAHSSIHIASFEFDLTPVADALIAAHNRGVDVRWVTDDEYGLDADLEPGHGQFKMLQNAGIKAVRASERTSMPA